MTRTVNTFIKTNTIPGMSGNNPGYYLGYYVPRRFQLNDPLSESILQVKNGSPTWTSAWATALGEELPQNLEPNLILRALGSSEEYALADRPMDFIGVELEKRWSNAIYQPNSLSKTHSTQPLKFLGRQERINEISDSYRFLAPSALAPNDTPTILILDDIVTTGSTMSEIVRAIQEVIPDAEVICVSLAMTYSGLEDARHDNALLYSHLNAIASGVRPSQTVAPQVQAPIVSLRTEDKARFLQDILAGKSKIELSYKYNLSKRGFAETIRELKESSDMEESFKVPPFPHVHLDEQSGGWVPNFGYNWIDENDKTFLGVKLNPPSEHLRLSPKGTNKWIPEDGYQWRSNESGDLSVVPKVYRKSRNKSK
jgi:hypothetical protein